MRETESAPPTVPRSDSGSLFVCAIVVTYDRKVLLREALAALRQQTRPADAILVVDNASQDGTWDLLSREFPQVYALRLQRNLGGAGGFVAGMSWAYRRGYEWLWLMDDDTIADPEALSKLLRAHDQFEAGQRPVLLASRVNWTDGSLHSMNPAFFKQWDLEALYRSVEQATLSLRSTTFVSCLLHRGAIERHGLPLADYFIWGDDTEFTARVLKDQFGVMVPASVVLHKTEMKHTALDAAPERFRLHVRNTLWMLLRSDAWQTKEKLRYALTLVAWIGRYLSRNGFGLAYLHGVWQGLWEGFSSAPRAINVDALVEKERAPSAASRK